MLYYYSVKAFKLVENNKRIKSNEFSNKMMANVAPKKSIKDLKVTIDTSTHTYTGKRRKCAISIFDGNKELEKGIDYKATYVNDLLPGKVSLIVSVKKLLKIEELV